MDPLTVRIKDADGWLTIEPQRPGTYETYAAHARFGRANLGGVWRVDLFDPPGFADELEKLHGTLNGEAILSDHDSFSAALTVDSTGHVFAAVQIEGWPFGIEGSIAFKIAIDQSYLPDLWRDVRAAFPQVADAPRRIGEELQ